MADFLDYLRECAKTLEGGLPSPEEEAMLASRAVEELGDRVLLVAADQRGSKALERLLRKTGHEAFAAVFQALLEAAPELAPNQYGSHVLEAALASWAERLESKPAEGQSEAPAAGPPVEPLLALCKGLSEDGSWPALVDGACASHVIRSLLLALGGYAPEARGKGKAAARAGCLPERRHAVPPEVADCRRSVAGALIALLRQDPRLCLGAHASPVVQLLLRVLKDRGDRGLAAEAAAAVVGAEGVGGKPSAERCEALLRSAPGSRALEAVLEVASAEAFGALFSEFFRRRLGELAAGRAGEFGPFLAQRVADGLREAPQLTLALKELDFATLLGAEAAPAQHAVVVRFLEACLRLRAGLKPAAAEVLRALNVLASSEHHRTWPALLSLDAAIAGPASLLRPPAAARRGARREGGGDAEASAAAGGSGAAGSESGARGGGEGGPPAVGASEDAGDGAAAPALAPMLRQLPAAGPQLLGTLLRFPGETVGSLNSGLAKLLEDRQVLRALAMDPKTARALETALAPSSALAPPLRLRLARGFRGLLTEIGPHPVGGWVCAAVWRASLGEAKLRKQLADELLSVEETLRAHNFAVWKVCGLASAKLKQEEWSQRQKKAGKAKQLFDKLIASGDTEAAKAVASAKARRAEDLASREAEMARRASEREVARLSDPLLAGLMAGDEEPDEEPEAEAAPRAAMARPSAGDTSTSTAKAKRKAEGDSDLAAALELISGKAPVRKRKKRTARGAAGGTAGAAPRGAASAPVGGRPSKRKRPGFVF